MPTHKVYNFPYPTFPPSAGLDLRHALAALSASSSYLHFSPQRDVGFSNKSLTHLILSCHQQVSEDLDQQSEDMGSAIYENCFQGPGCFREEGRATSWRSRDEEQGAPVSLLQPQGFMRASGAGMAGKQHPF